MRDRVEGPGLDVAMTPLRCSLAEIGRGWGGVMEGFGVVGEGGMERRCRRIRTLALKPSTLARTHARR